jgi:SAM-dependent MidA family methyltransferase
MSFRPWLEAWNDALYADSAGSRGFFLRHRPAEHFRTSVTASPIFAEAVGRAARDEGLDTVVDLGAGGGELLTHLAFIDPGLSLVGVDLAPRPEALPAQVAWLRQLPDSLDGLLLAHEWLDNIPCPVVEVDDGGVVRFVEVDPATGEERLGEPADSPWLERWWRLDEPGTRAEIGQPRDDAWADAVSRVNGLAIAVDYGHLVETRPPFGSLASYANGLEVDILPDGTRDVTAHVAVDSVADRVGGCLERQRDALARLGVVGTRPPHELAAVDPSEYVRLLSRASEAAELRARGGWGDFWWIVTDTRPSVVE